MNHEIEKELHGLFGSEGYTNFKQLPDGSWACLYKFMFTWAILHDLSPTGYADRWCYKTHDDALNALNQWNDPYGEPQGWHRHPSTGRRVAEDGTLTINF